MNQVLKFSSIVFLTAKKDIKVASKYLPNFISLFIQLAIRLLFFILFASVVIYDGHAELMGKNLFVFYVSSIQSSILSTLSYTQKPSLK